MEQSFNVQFVIFGLLRLAENECVAIEYIKIKVKVFRCILVMIHPSLTSPREE